MPPTHPSLAQFERLVAERNLTDAIAMLIALLRAIDERYGRLDLVDLGDLTSMGRDEEIALIFSTRFAASMGRLLTDRGFSLDAAEYETLILHHRWIDL